jgi:hypothetical protein
MASLMSRRRIAIHRMASPLRCPWLLVAGMALLLAFAASPSSAQLTLKLQDYAEAPMTGHVNGSSSNAGTSAYLARLNFMAEEPGVTSNRFFVNDLNGPLYILDKTTKNFTEYLNFNGRDEPSADPPIDRTGLFKEFNFSSGFANGFITFQFDPAYATNGKFYTVHMESPSVLPGNNGPNNAATPGLNTTGFTTTSTVTTQGGASRQTVLLEWQDQNIADMTFQGTARELLRMDMSGSIHPMGDLIFNPTAEPGDADWRVMYISIGDGGAGEGSGTTRLTPQRLDLLGGKILRIVPDTAEHVGTSTLSANGRYRIPIDNPFTSISNSAVKDEVFALGLRNPHRMSWDVDPENPANNHLIVNDIGLHTWEEVNIIHAGANYGYSQREGNQQLLSNNSTGPIPSPDLIPVQVTSSVTAGTVTPRYPVAQYGHGNAGQAGFEGDSISSGYVYRGDRIPSLRGKYIFGEITTGQLFYCEYAEMLAADDNDPNTMAEIHAINILWDDPNDAPNEGEENYGTTTTGGVLGPMFQIARAGYVARGGLDPALPGAASVTGGNGRADIRLQIDEAGELYILSKSDGMIRALVGPEADADFDQDGDVDGSDFLRWQLNAGTAGGLRQGDANADGFVDGKDLDYWSQRFGDASPLTAVVPEPGAGVLTGMATLACLLLGATQRTTTPEKAIATA